MDEVERLRADVEALKVVIGGLLMTSKEPLRSIEQANVRALRSTFADLMTYSPRMSDEQLEHLARTVDTLLALPGA